MPRIIAFLRAINVGGHTVTMAKLRTHFEALGLESVETFIASGNVIFIPPPRGMDTLHQRIEQHLHTSLGYEVATFLRTDAELAALARHPPFTDAAVRSAGALCVGFLAAPLGAAAKQSVMAFRTDIDDFHIRGREVYWLCARKQSESTFTNARFERALGVRATFRGLNTVTRLAAKYPPSPGAGA